MVAVAVCDDSGKTVDSIKENIEEYGKAIQKDIRVFSFYSGEELLESYKCNIDILFLDIRMPGMDGVSVAERIRQKDKKVIIIFLTSLVQYALDGYRVDASNYIIKPVSRKRLNMELERWIGELEKKEEPFITIHNDGGDYKILLKSIRYIETYRRNLMVHTDKTDIVCYWKLKDMEEKTGQYGFARSHASYLVNLFYVENIKKLDLMLTTGEILPVGKSKKKAFMEQLGRYWGGKI